jgi:hypothetical protein
MNTAGVVPCPGGVRTAVPLIASTNLVRSLSTLDPALAALALAKKMRQSFFLQQPQPYKLQQQFFYPQPPWPLRSLRPSDWLGAGFWWRCKHWQELDKGKGEHGSCIPVGSRTG